MEEEGEEKMTKERRYILMITNKEKNTEKNENNHSRIEKESRWRDVKMQDLGEGEGKGRKKTGGMEKKTDQ